MEGKLLPNAEELAEQEHQRAEQAQLQIRQIAVNLLQQKMGIQQVAQLTGLSESEIEQLR